MNKATISATLSETVGQVTRTHSASIEIYDAMNWEKPLQQLFEQLRFEEQKAAQILDIPI